MARRLRAALLVAVSLIVLSAPAAAQTAQRQGGYLAELGFDAWLSGDVQGLSGTMRWHLNQSSDNLWSLGVRGEGARVDARDTTVTAGILDLVAGFSRRLSGNYWPIVEVAIGKPFGEGGRFGLDTTVAAGSRVRLSGGRTRDFALRLMVFRTELSGRHAQPNLSTVGVAVGIEQARLSR